MSDAPKTTMVYCPEGGHHYPLPANEDWWNARVETCNDHRETFPVISTQLRTLSESQSQIDAGLCQLCEKANATVKVWQRDENWTARVCERCARGGGFVRLESEAA